MYVLFANQRLPIRNLTDGKVNLIHHFVIHFVNDFWQVTNKTYRHNITEILFKGCSVF